MVTIVGSGTYTLSETRHGIKLLRLSHKLYAWITAPHIGDLLIHTTLPHDPYDVLSEGSYRLYSVVDEPELNDQLHLELEVGRGRWQGYLLPVGFPTQEATKRRLIPTREMITRNLRFQSVRRPSGSVAQPQNEPLPT